MRFFLAGTEQSRWGANGQLMSVTNEHGKMAFQCDDAQRLVGEQQRQFGKLPALSWHTYVSGYLHGLSAPEMNLEIDLEPDALHRETRRRLTLAAGDQAHRYALDAAGNRLDGQKALTDGARHRFDGAGNMIEKPAANGEYFKLDYDDTTHLI